MELPQAIKCIQQNAEQHQGKTPTLGTLLEEVAELARSLEGKHEHAPGLELIQIGGIVANMLARYDWLDVHSAVRDRYSFAAEEHDPSFVCEGCGRETHIKMNGLCVACVEMEMSL
jgi:hypothetical protein